MSEVCNGAIGRETREHTFIAVRRSSRGDEPHLFCAKCGERRPLPGRDSQASKSVV